MIGDAAALFLAEHPALLFDARNDALDRDGEVVERDLVGAAPGRGDRRFIDQVGEIGTGEARGQGGDLVQIDVVADEVLVIMESGKVMRSPVSGVPAKGRDTMGVIFAKPAEGDRIIAIARNVERNLGDEEAEGEEPAL